MKVKLKETTQTTKPKARKIYAPQTPDSNRPDLEKPTPPLTRSKKSRSKK